VPVRHTHRQTDRQTHRQTAENNGPSDLQSGQQTEFYGCVSTSKRIV